MDNKNTSPISEQMFAPLTINDADFNRLVNFVQTNYGINLAQ